MASKTSQQPGSILRAVTLLGATAVATGIALRFYQRRQKVHTAQSSLTRVVKALEKGGAKKDWPPLKNDLILRAAKGEPTERVPVWVMRQAGRYLPEFRAERKTADFFTICRTPELVAKVTLQPLARFPLDAAIIFSDILVVPQALGMEVLMLDSIGPVFPAPLTSPKDLSRLSTNVNVYDTLGYVYEGISETRRQLNGSVPLFGFTGAPWTLMAYMIEGKTSKLLEKSKGWLYQYPVESHALLQRITDVVVDHLVGQVKAGAQLLQVFDSWGGVLAPHVFEEFSLQYLTQIAKRTREEISRLDVPYVPLVVFAKDAHYFEALAGAGFDVVSVDWAVDPADVRQRVAGKVSLQGNLDPVTLYASESVVRAETRKMIDTFGTQRYIANLGHGMYPNLGPDAVSWFVDEVHRYSESVNKKKEALPAANDARPPPASGTTSAVKK